MALRVSSRVWRKLLLGGLLGFTLALHPVSLRAAKRDQKCVRFFAEITWGAPGEWTQVPLGTPVSLTASDHLMWKPRSLDARGQWTSAGAPEPFLGPEKVEATFLGRVSANAGEPEVALFLDERSNVLRIPTSQLRVRAPGQVTLIPARLEATIPVRDQGNQPTCAVYQAVHCLDWLATAGLLPKDSWYHSVDRQAAFQRLMDQAIASERVLEDILKSQSLSKVLKLSKLQRENAEKALKAAGVAVTETKDMDRALTFLDQEGPVLVNVIYNLQGTRSGLRTMDLGTGKIQSRTIPPFFDSPWHRRLAKAFSPLRSITLWPKMKIILAELEKTGDQAVAGQQIAALQNKSNPVSGHALLAVGRVKQGPHAGSVIVIDSNFGTTYVISEDELRKGASTFGMAQPINN